MRIGFSKRENIRNFVFGVEDSLVSTVGLVSGIAIAGVPKTIVILTGTVLIFVEAFSMAVGALLSDNSVREFEKHSPVSFSKSVQSSLVMFVSYLFSGFIVLVPYLYFEGGEAIRLSIAASVIALFLLGVVSARFSQTSFWKKGLLMAAIGGLAVLIGVLVSGFLK